MVQPHPGAGCRALGWRPLPCTPLPTTLCSQNPRNESPVYSTPPILQLGGCLRDTGAQSRTPGVCGSDTGRFQQPPGEKPPAGVLENLVYLEVRGPGAVRAARHWVALATRTGSWGGGCAGRTCPTPPCWPLSLQPRVGGILVLGATSTAPRRPAARALTLCLYPEFRAADGNEDGKEGVQLRGWGSRASAPAGGTQGCAASLLPGGRNCILPALGAPGVRRIPGLGALGTAVLGPGEPPGSASLLG